MRSRRATWFLALAVVGGLLPLVARAEEGAMVYGRQERPPLLTLDPFKGSFGFRGLYDVVNVENRGVKSKATNWLMTEDLTLGGSGSVVSQNFLRWNGTVTASFQELETRTQDLHESSFGVFDAYDVNVDMLQSTPFPISAYAQRSETFVDRTFAALLKSTTTGYGGTIRYESPSLPSSLSISHTEIEQSDLGGNAQFNSSNDQITGQTSFQPLDRHLISLNYSYGNTSQNNPGVLTNQFETQTADLSHTWSIDPDGHYTLTEGVSYYEQTGVYPSKGFNFSESLHMNLTDYLSGQVDYRFINQQTGRVGTQANGLPQVSNELTSQSITGSLSHRLYNSLITTVRGGANFNESSYSGGSNTQSTADNYFTSINSTYTKKMGIGLFGANLGLGYDVANNSSVLGEQVILGELATLSDPQPIVLKRPGLNPDSIMVYDASGTRLLVRGIDYTVRQVGNTTQINRVIGGDIGGQDTVRLNYLVDPLAAYTADTTTFNAGANYLFEEGFLKGLKLYTQYFQSDQTITSNTDAILPDNIRDTLVGTDYQIWKLEFRAEAEDHASTLAPFRAVRFVGRYTDNLDPRTNLSLDLAQSFIDYPTDNAQVSVTAAGGQMSYAIMQDLTSRLIVRWRNEDDSVQGHTMGIEEELRLEYKIRQTNMYLGVRHTNLDTPGGSSESLFFQLGVTRNF